MTSDLIPEILGGVRRKFRWDFTTDTPPGFSFSRGGSGSTGFGPDGLLRIIDADSPGFDYDPITLAPRGIGIFVGKTNLALWNRDFTNAVWAKTTMTAAKDQIGIDGVVSSASSLTATGANATVLQTVTGLSSLRITSCYVKRISGTGTVNITQNNGTTWTAITLTSTWTRFKTISTILTDPIIGFRIVTNGDAIAVDYIQTEENNFITPVIPTTTIAVTRADETLSSTDVSWYNLAEGTFVVTAIGNDTAASNAQTFRIEGTGAEVMRMGYATTTTGTAYGANSVGTGQFNYALACPASGSSEVMALGYKTNNVNLAVNGVSGTPDTACTILTIPDTIFIGGCLDSLPTNYLNGWVTQIDYYTKRLPDAQLKRLSGV
jgi:hypothetical protein